ncbi:MAG: hypothetical protein GX947_02695 [Tissierellia bacterium]|nr:hypothetical protein [Tissierellia bacterium]
MKVLKVDGKDYIVHYSINSLVAMEETTGKPFTALFDNEAGIGIQTLRTIIYYGLTSKQRDLKLGDAGDIMDALIAEGKTIVEISEMFLNELTAALGMKTVVKEEESPN